MALQSNRGFRIGHVGIDRLVELPADDDSPFGRGQPRHEQACRAARPLTRDQVVAGSVNGAQTEWQRLGKMIGAETRQRGAGNRIVLRFALGRLVLGGLDPLENEPQAPWVER